MKETGKNCCLYTLQEESASGGVDAFYRGELKLGLKYVPGGGGSKPTGGTLVVDVKQAKELPPMNGETADSAVKLHLLPNRKSSGKRKTGVIKNNLNPVWEEKFTYEGVSLEELSRERVLEISVWNYEKSGNTFIGGLRIGPAPGSAAGGKPKDWMDSIGDEVTHWEDMLARPGEWVEQWHTLRTSLNPRSVGLKTSTSTPPAPPAVASSSSRTAPTEHAQKESSVATASTPVVLADEFKRTAPKTSFSAHIERKDGDSRVQPSTESATDEQFGDFRKISPKVTAVEGKEVKGQVQPSIESASDEPFKNITPVTTPIVHVKESRGQISAKVSSSEADKSPSRQTAVPPTKPVFSSSVRSRPNMAPVQTTTGSRDVKMVQESLPTSDSGTEGERIEPHEPVHEVRVELKTPSPRLGHKGEDETPSIRVEGERTPPAAPQAHSTPIMDLSEASRYTEENQGSPESRQRQVSYVLPVHSRVHLR